MGSRKPNHAGGILADDFVRSGGTRHRQSPPGHCRKSARIDVDHAPIEASQPEALSGKSEKPGHLKFEASTKGTRLDLAALEPAFTR